MLAREGLLKYCAPSGYNPETDGHTEWTGPGLCTLMGSRASSILPEPKQLIEGCAAGVSFTSSKKNTCERGLNTSVTGSVETFTVFHFIMTAA